MTTCPGTVYRVQWMYYKHAYTPHMYIATYVAVCTNSPKNEVRHTLCCTSHLTQQPCWERVWFSLPVCRPVQVCIG